MSLEDTAPVTDQRVAHRVRTVEAPRTMGAELIPDGQCFWLSDPLSEGTVAKLLPVVVEKLLAQALAHGLPELAHILPTQLAEPPSNRHHLLLIDNGPERSRRHISDRGMEGNHNGFSVPSVQELLSCPAMQWTRTRQRSDRHQVLKGLDRHLAGEVLERIAFPLEDAGELLAAEDTEGRGIVQGIVEQPVHRLADQPQRVLQHGQRPEPEHIDLEEVQRLRRTLVYLGTAPVIQRDDLHEGLRRHHVPRRMGPAVACVAL